MHTRTTIIKYAFRAVSYRRDRNVRIFLLSAIRDRRVARSALYAYTIVARASNLRSLVTSAKTLVPKVETRNIIVNRFGRRSAARSADARARAYVRVCVKWRCAF